MAILSQYDLVVIDEISMLSAEPFERVLEMWRAAEKLPCLVLLSASSGPNPDLSAELDDKLVSTTQAKALHLFSSEPLLPAPFYSRVVESTPILCLLMILTTTIYLTYLSTWSTSCKHFPWVSSKTMLHDEDLQERHL